MMTINEDMKIILDSISTPVLIIDAQKKVIFANTNYLNLINITNDKFIGQRIDIIRPNSKIGDVVETGIPLRRIKRETEKNHFFSDIYPIISKGKIVGAISTSFEKNSIQQLLDKLKETEENIYKLKSKIYSAPYTFNQIIGSSVSLERAINQAKLFASENLPVLITGESGTGKELFAQSIHNYSNRKNAPFIAVNCATLENSLLESELFGYEAGTFTGASTQGKKGLFEEAHGGTIFLDEITEISISTQSKLLRVLQEKTIRPVGSSKEKKIDVQIICSTNKDISEMISQKLFKDDLFYRISTFTLHVPPLRQRKEDILELSNSFLNQTKDFYQYDNTLLDFFNHYEWPGNIRELKNVIEFIKVMSPDYHLSIDYLPEYLKKSVTIEKSNNFPSESSANSLKEYLKLAEKDYIQRILTKYPDTTEGKKAAAEELNVSLASLYNKMR